MLLTLTMALLMLLEIETTKKEEEKKNELRWGSFLFFKRRRSK